MPETTTFYSIRKQRNFVSQIACIGTNNEIAAIFVVSHVFGHCVNVVHIFIGNHQKFVPSSHFARLGSKYDQTHSHLCAARREHNADRTDKCVRWWRTTNIAFDCCLFVSWQLREEVICNTSKNILKFVILIWNRQTNNSRNMGQHNRIQLSDVCPNACTIQQHLFGDKQSGLEAICDAP